VQSFCFVVAFRSMSAMELPTPVAVATALPLQLCPRLLQRSWAFPAANNCLAVPSLGSKCNFSAGMLVGIALITARFGRGLRRTVNHVSVLTLRRATRKKYASNKKKKAPSRKQQAPSQKQQFDPAEVEAAKAGVRRACLESKSIWTTEPVKRRINVAVQLLEELDCTDYPATTNASIVNGNWNLLYSSSRSVPAGVWGPVVGTVSQRLQAGKRVQQTTVDFLAGILKFEWTSDFNASSDTEWEMPEEEWVPVLFGLPLSIMSFDSDNGMLWRFTYTDKDMRIMRSEAWVKREGKVEDIWVLERKR